LKSEEQELAPKAADLLERWGWVEAAAGEAYRAPGLTISSFHLEQLGRSLAVLPGVRHCWLVRRIEEADLSAGARLGIGVFSADARQITEEQIALCRDRGVDVRAWGVRDLRDLGRLVRLGVKATTVDWPGRAREYLERIGVR
jgi:glycerophosphoryl diester phosphodiesterase